VKGLLLSLPYEEMLDLLISHSDLCHRPMSEKSNLTLKHFSYVVLSDSAYHPSQTLLPANLEALGVLSLPGHYDRYICRGTVCLRGDRGELLLHPQYLAHADRRECGFPPAASRQTRRQGDAAEA